LDEDGEVRECRYPIEALLAHRPPMLLLDKVVGYDDTSLLASVTITESSLLLGPHGVPGHVAIEYMAQACGAFAGAIALDGGTAVKIGFLLGTRMCKVSVPWFRIGDRLLISASLVFRDEQMAVFDCKIEIDGKLAAEAQLKVYQPDNELLLVDEVE
jgi:predicted hotdog family 3-hydroxylacyl-ACP dehydratase